VKEQPDRIAVKPKSADKYFGRLKNYTNGRITKTTSCIDTQFYNAIDQ